MKSMTGFGRNKSQQGGIVVITEIQSVNRKNLEIHVSLPREYQSLEIHIHNWVKNHASRGKFNVSIQIQDPKATTGLAIDQKQIDQAVSQLKALSDSLAVPFDFDTSDLIRLIGMHKPHTLSDPDLEQITPVLESSLTHALGVLNTVRATEGRHLQEDLQKRIQLLLKMLTAVEERSPEVSVRYRKQFKERLKNAGLPIDLDDERILRELAIFSDKSDVTEEITRLKSHLVQFENDLHSNEVIGRKLDFLCQEIHREWNTIGSKANFLEITQIVVEAKNELERIREQVQNIE